MGIEGKGYASPSHYIDFEVDPAFDEDPVGALFPVLEKKTVVAGRNNIFDGVHVPNNNFYPNEDQDVFLVLGFEAWRQFSSDNEAFANNPAYMRAIGKAFGKTLMTMDEPDHSHYKRLIMPSFSHRSVTTDIASLAAPIISECLDQVAHKGRGELMSEFTLHFPYLIVAKLFGVPPDLAQEAHSLVINSMRLGDDPAAAMAAYEGMEKLYMEVVQRHKVGEHDNLTSMLMDTEVNGVRLTDEEVVSFIKMIMAAGLDTTVRQTSNLIYLLLENPEQFEDLKANPDLLESAIWESTRLIPAGGNQPRWAVRDTVLDGVHIPKGSGLYGILNLANVDPRIWEDPLKFDIRRKKRPIASFGTGPHVCLGMSLSLVEMKIAMEGVLERLPNLRKDPEYWDQVKVRGLQLRSPTMLPVLWDA